MCALATLIRSPSIISDGIKSLNLFHRS